MSFLDNLAAFEHLLKNTGSSFYFFSSKASKLYTEISYKPDDFLIFGSETSGLPLSFNEQWPENFAKIPMIEGQRCLNLATSVGIVLYEAWRQQGFK